MPDNQIPAGVYLARPAGSGFFGAIETTGTEYVDVTMTILEGADEGGTVRFRGFLSEKASARTVEALRNMGCIFPGADIFNLEGLGSRDVRITVQHNENGYAEVRFVDDPSKTRGGSVDKDAVRSRMKGLLASLHAEDSKDLPF